MQKHAIDHTSEALAVAEARIKDLEAVLGQNDDNIAVAFRLPPALSNLLGLLLAVPRVTPVMVRQRLEIATDPKVAFHRLRKCLEPFEIEIESQRHLGYWLEPDMKKKVKEFVTSRVTQADVAPEPQTEQVEELAA